MVTLEFFVVKAGASVGVVSRVEGGAVLETHAAMVYCSCCRDTVPSFKIEVGIGVDNTARWWPLTLPSTMRCGGPSIRIHIVRRVRMGGSGGSHFPRLVCG